MPLAAWRQLKGVTEKKNYRKPQRYGSESYQGNEGGILGAAAELLREKIPAVGNAPIQRDRREI